MSARRRHRLRHRLTPAHPTPVIPASAAGTQQEPPSRAHPATPIIPASRAHSPRPSSPTSSHHPLATCPQEVYTFRVSLATRFPMLFAWLALLLSPLLPLIHLVPPAARRFTRPSTRGEPAKPHSPFQAPVPNRRHPRPHPAHPAPLRVLTSLGLSSLPPCPWLQNLANSLRKTRQSPRPPARLPQRGSRAGGRVFPQKAPYQAAAGSSCRWKPAPGLVSSRTVPSRKSPPPHPARHTDVRRKPALSSPNGPALSSPKENPVFAGQTAAPRPRQKPPRRTSRVFWKKLLLRARPPNCRRPAALLHAVLRVHAPRLLSPLTPLTSLLSLPSLTPPPFPPTIPSPAVHPPPTGSPRCPTTSP